MIFIKVTYRFIHSEPVACQRFMGEISHAVCHSLPRRAHHLIVTDDLDTAVIQCKDQPQKTQVVMIDIDDISIKTHDYKGVTIIPYSGVSLTDEIFKLIKGR